MHKGRSPLVGGAARFLAAWGEPARPGFPPEGKRERGDLASLLPQAFGWREIVTQGLQVEEGVKKSKSLKKRRFPYLATSPDALQRTQASRLMISYRPISTHSCFSECFTASLVADVESAA